MKMIAAAIARGAGMPLIVDEVQIREPGDGEVMVQMQSSGLCHTDLSVLEGKFPVPLPAILGHEGAGLVTEIGPNVEQLEPGDHVILDNVPHCGHCPPCRSGRTSYCDQMVELRKVPTPFTWQGNPLASMAPAATFASHTVVGAAQVTRIDPTIPFASAALVPCGVITGVGAVLSVAKVHAGGSVVVIGIGSVGLSVVQACRVAGAARIVAVDLNPAREAYAREFGATDFVGPDTAGQQLSDFVPSLTGGLVDYAFECVGSPRLVAEALALVNEYWGVCVAFGIAPFDQQIVLPATTFYFGRTLRGTLLGDANPKEYIPRILSHYMDGSMSLDSLVTHRVALDQINEGFDLMKSGDAVRVVIEF